MKKTNYLTQEIADALGFEIVDDKKMYHSKIDLMFYDEAGLFNGTTLLSQVLTAVGDWIENGGVASSFCTCGKSVACPIDCENKSSIKC